MRSISLRVVKKCAHRLSETAPARRPDKPSQFSKAVNQTEEQTTGLFQLDGDPRYRYE